MRKLNKNTQNHTKHQTQADRCFSFVKWQAFFGRFWFEKLIFGLNTWRNDAKLIVYCFMSPPIQYRLYGRRFLQVKRPNQQYQSTEGKSTKDKSNNGNNTKHTCI